MKPGSSWPLDVIKSLNILLYQSLIIVVAWCIPLKNEGEKEKNIKQRGKKTFLLVSGQDHSPKLRLFLWTPSVWFDPQCHQGLFFSHLLDWQLLERVETLQNKKIVLDESIHLSSTALVFSGRLFWSKRQAAEWTCVSVWASLPPQSAPPWDDSPVAMQRLPSWWSW